jgi:predicted nucleic acid-binding protein
VILVDTNVLVAAARAADINHDAAARLLETVDEPLLVPPTVLAEACYLLSEWGGPQAEVRFLRDFRPDGLQLTELTTC